MPVIRPAQAEDVPEVLPLVRRICEQHRQWDQARYDYDQDPAQRYDGWLRQRVVDARSVFLVAVMQNRVVGFIVGTTEHEIPIYSLKEYGFIHDLWVDEHVRRQGIGQQLAQAAVDQFTRLGVRQIRLDTAWPNDHARTLFARCGFRPSTVEMLHQI